MAKLRTSAEVISLAMNVRSEGLGIRATARVLGKSGSSIINWEKRLSEQLFGWSPSAAEGSEVTLNGDEVYWVRPHWGLGKNKTPAMAMGYLERPVTMLELLSSRSFQYITP
jgi:hypothetical protein